MNKSQPYAQQPALSLAHGTRSANIYSINKLCLFFKWSLLIICKSLAENLSMWIQHLYTQSCYSIKRFFWIPYFMAGAPIGLGVRSWAKTPVLPWWVCRRCWPHQSTDKCGINCSGKMYNATDDQGGWPGRRGPRRLPRGAGAPWPWQQWGMWEGMQSMLAGLWLNHFSYTHKWCG